MSDASRDPIIPQLPRFRASPTPGRVLFGFATYQYTETKDVGLAYETTPDRAREIAAELIAAANDAERIATCLFSAFGRVGCGSATCAKFPALVPVDDTKAIEAEVV